MPSAKSQEEEISLSVVINVVKGYETVTHSLRIYSGLICQFL